MQDARDAEFDAFAGSDHIETRWTVVNLEARHGDSVLRGSGHIDQVAVIVAADRCQLPWVSFSCFCLFGLAAFLCFVGGRGPLCRVCLTLRGAGSAFSPFSLPCGFVALRLGFAR
jgi:hypothetical protein